MFNKVLFFLLLSSLLTAQTAQELAGGMLMVGFHGTSAKPNSQICQDIAEYNLAGVILFDFNPIDKNKPKNIANKAQLAQLTKELQKCSRGKKLLIAVDQEGGNVQRLKSKYGFYGKFPQASQVSKLSPKDATRYYDAMAKELKSVGINFNLAPVVDLDINPKNHVIHELGRSFGKDPAKVAQFASLFIESMHRHGVLSSLKHFPGHGSSTRDSHKGFVDVTAQWQRNELYPYKLLIDKSKIDTVMVAHVFNAQIDTDYPATLSAKTVKSKLRGDIGFNGVIITDDLQMGAITHKYSLAHTLQLAINAGNDILLFGNQLDPRSVVSTKLLVDTIVELEKEGKVNPKSIQNANIRIDNLKKRL